jgi:hypothetical protein
MQYPCIELVERLQGNALHCKRLACIVHSLQLRLVHRAHKYRSLASKRKRPRLDKLAKRLQAETAARRAGFKV